MAQVNERKNEMVGCQKVGILAIKTNEQCSKLVHPGKTAFTCETLLVNSGIEEPFSSPFGIFTVAFVLADVGNEMVIETDFASIKRIKGAVGVEKGTVNGQSQAFDGFESLLKVGFEVKGVMMVAGHDPRRSNHIALSVGNRQNIRGLGSFPALIRHAFAPFFRQRVTTVEIQLRQIELGSDGLDAVLPNPFQTAIRAPFAEVIIDRLPANLFFSGSSRVPAMGNCLH